MANNEEHLRSKKNEILIATIGLVGVLTTAAFSNWDKIFPKQDVLQASYSGYRPTGSFETELRYFFEVSGMRTTMENTKQQLLSNFKTSFISQHPEKANEIDSIMNAALAESPKFDEIMTKLLPVYQKHFTIEEIQELNKINSTEIVQNMIKKMPLLTQDAAPIQVEILQDFQKRYFVKVDEILKKKETKEPK